MRLIFIEGVSGVGKTTLAQTLCGKLNEMGHAAYCYLEGDIANPIDFYCTAYLTREKYADLLADCPMFSEDIARNTIVAEDVMLVRYHDWETPLFPEPLLTDLCKHEFCWDPVHPVPISEYTRVYKSVWEQFALNASKQHAYLIFDGSLLHHPINDMTRNYDASPDQVMHHINMLIETVHAFRPWIVYLSSDDVAGQLRKALLCRQQPPPSAEQIQFWENRMRMDFAVMRQLSISYDILDISEGNWDFCLQYLLNELR